jgi:predicted metal-dependent peptidase
VNLSWHSLNDLSAQARTTWSAARVWAARQAPYLATAVLALDPVVVRAGPGTAAPDLRGYPADAAWHVYIDPTVLESAEPATVGFWLLHQVTHLLRQHADRYPGTPVPDSQARPTLAGRTPDQQRWNVAGDCEINDDLHAGELTLPAEAVTPDSFAMPDGWTAEQYWDTLGRSTSGGQTDPPEPDAGAEPQRGSPESADSGTDCGTDCGTGCDGQPRPWNCGRPGLTPIGRRLLGQDVARRIREHQRRRGDVPAGWQRWADDLLDPVVNWRRQLAAAVRRGVADVAGRVDFTYRRPSRRAAATPDVVLPSLRQPLPQVAMVLDTSGSMSDGMLAQALGEVGGVLRSLGLGRRNLRVICCDAQAYEHQRVLDAREVRLLGGGGTDMGAGLAAATGLRPRPDLVVVLTDGHTPWPSRPPEGVRVVVGLMDEAGHVPDWATTVLVDTEHAAAGQ